MDNSPRWESQYRRTSAASTHESVAVTNHNISCTWPCGARMPNRVGCVTLKPSEPPSTSVLTNTPYSTIESASVNMAKKMPR